MTVRDLLIVLDKLDRNAVVMVGLSAAEPGKRPEPYELLPVSDVEHFRCHAHQSSAVNGKVVLLLWAPPPEACNPNDPPAPTSSPARAEPVHFVPGP